MMPRHSANRIVSWLAAVVLGLAPVLLFVENATAALCGGSVLPVENVELEGFRSIRSATALGLLDLEKGKPCDQQKLRRGLRRLFLKGLFDDLSVKMLAGEEGVRLRVVAREKPRITEIAVTGNHNIQTARILEELPLKRWAFFTSGNLAGALEKLTERLRLFGYPDVRVAAEAIRVNDFGDVRLEIDVAEGTSARIREVRVEGSPDDTMSLLKTFLKPGDVRDGEKIDKDAERIRTYWSGKGYVKAEVQPEVGDDGMLVFYMAAGPRYEVRFEGNDTFSESVLRKEVLFGEAEDMGMEAVEEGARRIVRFYKGKGYPFVGVATELEEGEALTVVRFFIHEGNRCTVERVVLTGAGDHEERLRGVLSQKKGTEYSASDVEADRERLSRALNRLGYLSARVEPVVPVFAEDGRSVELDIRVEPGLRSWVRKIEFVGMNVFPVPDVLHELGLEEAQPYDEVRFIDGRYRLLDKYVQAGYAGAQVHLETTFTPDGEWATVVFRVEEGVLHRFGKIIVKGNRRTRDEVIVRELGVEEGAVFSPGLLPLGKRALYQLGIFSEVNVQALDAAEGYKDVLVTVREAKPGTVELGLGYGDYDRFRGLAEVKYGNLWGVNRGISVRGEYGSQARRILLTFSDPWTFRRQDLPFRASFLVERTEEVNADTRDILWQQRRTALSATFDKDLTETLKGSAGYEYSFVDTFDVEPDVQLSPEDEGTVGISSLIGSLVRDTRDNPFNPTAGSVTGAVVKVASEFIFSETDFVKLTLQHSRFQRHAYNVVSALSIRTGLAEGLRDTRELPIVERFFLGGRTTVRGYDQRELGPKGEGGSPTGGNAFINLNAELRIPIWRDLGGVLFLDGGNVWLEAADLDPTDLRFTAGAGIRYGTPVGPIRVDYGFKLDREEGESSGELHFSLGHAF